MGRQTHVFFAVGWYHDAELFCYDDMKNVVSFSCDDKSDIESLKSQHKIKWLVGTLGSDGMGRWGFQSQHLHAPPYCSIWASFTSQWTSATAACSTNGNVKARKCVAELGVDSTSLKYLIYCNTPRISLLVATDFLHAAERVTDSSGISFRLSFCPCMLLCPVFPLIWIGIKIELTVNPPIPLGLNQE